MGRFAKLLRIRFFSVKEYCIRSPNHGGHVVEAGYLDETTRVFTD